MEYLLAHQMMFVHAFPARHQYWDLKTPVVQGKVLCYKADKNFSMLEHETAEICYLTGFISISSVSMYF